MERSATLRDCVATIKKMMIFFYKEVHDREYREAINQFSLCI